MFTASGYAFVAFGSGWFFDNVIAAVHMRRHYFQLGLLAHLELASLLSFSSRISRVVAEYDPVRHSAEWFERAMHAIEDEYLGSSLFRVGGNDPIWSSLSVSLFGWAPFLRPGLTIEGRRGWRLSRMASWPPRLRGAKRP